MPERSSPTASRRITPRSVTEQPPVQRTRTPGGVVIAVYGARADVGVTTVARSLARAFRSLGTEEVAHAELDPRVVRARKVPAPVNEADRYAIPGLNAALVRQSDDVWTL